jgi:plastocyanin
VDGDKWKPVHKYIGKGDTVKWTNVDDTRHDLTAYGGRWSFAADLDPGESAKKRFKKLGTFKYRCVIHSGIVDGKCQGMCGFVHVSKR